MSLGGSTISISSEISTGQDPTSTAQGVLAPTPPGVPFPSEPPPAMPAADLMPCRKTGSARTGRMKIISIGSNPGVIGMPEGPDPRMTVSVGQREFEELNREWADYVAATSGGPGPVDPVLTLRRTGRILRSLDRLLASMDREDGMTQQPSAPTSMNDQPE